MFNIRVIAARLLYYALPLILFVVPCALTLKANQIVNSISASATSVGTVVNFDNFQDGDVVTDQVSGMVFSNTGILTAGVGLDEDEAPPHSLPNVATDVGNPITITFDQPIYAFFGYFTYTQQISAIAFDAGGQELGSVQSHYSNNLALSGDRAPARTSISVWAFRAASRV